MSSVVAGIVSPNGGLRVVITEFSNLMSHVGKHEICYVLPGVLVEEPVPINEMGDLIDRVESHIKLSREFAGG
jgi:hypothetical protein